MTEVAQDLRSMNDYCRDAAEALHNDQANLFDLIEYIHTLIEIYEALEIMADEEIMNPPQIKCAILMQTGINKMISYCLAMAAEECDG